MSARTKVTLRAKLCPRAILYVRANLTATQYSKVKRGCYLQVNIIFLVFYSDTFYFFLTFTTTKFITSIY